MKTIAACTLLVLAVSLPAFGQLTYRYSEWAEGPVRHLMSKDEIKEWKALQSDDQAKEFIDLFWARRDPTPATPANEFLAEFNARVELANRQFSRGTAPGSMTDQGKVLILLGMPYQISSRGGSQSASSIGDVGTTAPTDASGALLLPSTRGQQAMQTWSYAHDKKPKFIAQSDFVMVFSEEGINNWQLAHTERTNPDAILLQAARAVIVSPRLSKAPFTLEVAEGRKHSNVFKDIDLGAAYQTFHADPKPVVGPGTLTWDTSVTPAGEQFLSAQLYAPAGSGIEAGQKLTFLTVIANERGEVVEVDEEPVTMVASGKDAYADTSVRIEPGTYTATFGLASAGKIITATKTPLKIERLDPAASAISQLLLSSDIKPRQDEYSLTDPFTYGGLKVVPKGDLVFPPAGDLWYFAELRNPGVNADGTPKVQVKVDIIGKTAKGPVEMKFPASVAETAPLKGVKDRYALGLAIPLETFVAGEYTMKVHVVDTVLSKSYDFERQFRVRM